jgi:ligand-binding sensor domain-containing protein
MKLKPYQFKKIIFATLFLIMNTTFSFNANAQKVSDFIFETYSVKEGLSQSSARVIYQDKLGYIWVGTESGINRFDGYEFKQYNHDIKNAQSRANGWIQEIREDAQGNLWTSDVNGHLCFLDRTKDVWKNYNIPIKDSLLNKNPKLPSYFGAINKMYVDDAKQEIWMATWGIGLLKFDIASKKYTPYLIHPKDSVTYGKQEFITQIKRYRNKLILGTDIGLQYFDMDSKKLSKIFNFPDSIFITQPTDFQIEGDKLYAATNYGAFIYDLKTNEKIIFANKKGNDQTIAANTINSIYYSKSSNYLWLTFLNAGIDVINLTTSKIIHINNTVSKEYGIAQTDYKNIIEDKDNNIWLSGSHADGVTKYDPGKRKFGVYKKSFPSDFNLGFSMTWGLFLDHQNHIWVGEFEPNGGIYEIDRVNKTKKSYFKDDKINYLRRWSFAEDAFGNLFTFNNTPEGSELHIKKAGKNTFESLGLLKKRSSTTIGYNKWHTFSTANHELILSGEKPLILSDSNGKQSFGFLVLPKELKKGIYSAYRKSSFEIYIQNDDGIFVWNEKTNNVNCLTKNIKNFYELEDGRDASFAVIDNKLIFIATYGNGIMKLDLEKNTKTFLTKIDGIPNLDLYDMYLGKDKNLWISSNYSLIRYNPYTNKFRSFGPAEGVQDFEFNSNTSFQSSTGELFFGGVKGLNYFFPDSIKDNSKPPVVIIQSLTKKDSVLHIESTHSPLEYTIKYNENNLSFDYVAFNYRDALHNKYAYKMEGYDEDWIYVGSRRFASYNNLREGTYTFRVKAANNDGIWNEEGAKMVIHILPPPWRTWWAYLIYFISSITFIYVFSKYREKQQFKKLENERKNSELAAAKDLQERLLPKTLPVIKNLDIAGYLRTSTEVGGDYYDFFEQPDGSLYAICGDATGHGTPSGMLVSITKAGIIGLPQMSPKDMLHELNRVVKKVDLGILRMSLNIALVKDNQITLSSAGMPPYFVYRASTNTTEEIQLSGVPLGSFNDVHFDQTSTSFNSGDILVIISDGLPEAPNLAGELFDYQKLQDLITTYGNKTAQEVIDQLMIEADAWLSGNHNPDDITLVVIKHK